MYDFLKVSMKYNAKTNRRTYEPSFEFNSRIKDIMTRGRDFYALFDPETNLWITREDKAIELIDSQVDAYVKKEYEHDPDILNDKEHGPIVLRIQDTDSRMIDKWHKFVQKDLRDKYHPLNQTVKFKDDLITQKDYCTFKLSYQPSEGPTPFYEKLVSTLYSPSDREKFEWAIGCLFAGDQGKVQKMFLFYGVPGAGKSTILKNILVDELLEKSSYAVNFKAEELVNRDSFGTAFLGQDPALAYDLEAGLERIDSSGTLNKVISHEPVKVNDKFRSTFVVEPKCLVMACSNDTIQLTPGKGMSRRLVDIRPTGITLPPDEYDECLEHLKFEKQGIAWHCLQVYHKLGKNFYNHYRPEDMVRMTSPFQNFVADNYLQLRDGITLVAAYDIYKRYAEESNFKTVLTRYRFRDSLRMYFKKYSDGKFSEFKPETIGLPPEEKPSDDISTDSKCWLQFSNKASSLLDSQFKDCPAQYANDDGTPTVKWDNCTTKLKDILPSKLHYVLVPNTLIVIDLDIKGDDGKKNFELNYKEALKFPPTYAELSKSGQGIHLHYIYTGGDPDKLSRVFSDNVEVKVFTGKSSLRRQLTKCNDIPIAEIATGLPLKEEKKVPTMEGFEDEKKLINTVKKAMRKEIDGCNFTKPATDFIVKLVKSAYESGKTYDIRTLWPSVISFAMNSTHNAEYCMNAINYLHWCSKDIEDAESKAAMDSNRIFAPTAPIIFFDCEVFKNLFVICWKFEGKDKSVVKMINPKPEEVKRLFKFRLIGFNNRKYDNHILWARASGYSLMELYNLSQSIVKGDRNAMFGQAYNLSYTDIYDFAGSGEKMGLKKYEILFQKQGKLVDHHENAIPWDAEVPKERFGEIADYCKDDVLATEETFNYLEGSWQARQILAELATDLNAA